MSKTTSNDVPWSTIAGYGLALLTVIGVVVACATILLSDRNTSGPLDPSAVDLLMPTDICVIDDVPQLTVGLSRDNTVAYPYISYINLEGDYVVYDKHGSFVVPDSACPDS